MSEAEVKERDLKTALLTEDGGRRGCWPKDAGSLQEVEKTGIDFPHKPAEGTQTGVTCFSLSRSISELSPPRNSLGDDVARLKVLRFLSVIDRTIGMKSVTM